MGCGGSKGAKKEETKATSQQSGSTNKDQDKKAAKEENAIFAEKMQFLQGVKLFKGLPKDQHPMLAEACGKKDATDGEFIIKQGDDGHEFFVIREGEAAVLIDQEGEQKQVTTLKVGDYFGENALLRNETRNASIKAKGVLKMYVITRQKFQDLGLTDKLVFANRKAVMGGGKRNVDTKPPSKKSPTDRELIAKALKENENLQTMVTLDDSRVGSIVDISWEETVPKDTDIIKEGDLMADYFYIVKSGNFEIYVSDVEEGKSAEAKAGQLSNSKLVSTVSAAGSFGELALLYLVPRAATVRAKEDSTVFVIDRQNFKSILMQVSEAKIAEYVKYLDRVETFEPLLSEEKKQLARALVEMHFQKDEIILEEGEMGNSFYILYDGEIRLTNSSGLDARKKASTARAECEIFGERALLYNEPRGATVTVVSETAKALALDRDSFSMLLGPIEEVLKGNKGGAKGQQAGAGEWDKKRKGKILRKDLTKIGLLGCGGFGAVELYEHKVTKESYAMKGLSKGYIVKTGMQESVMNEKNILMMTNSNFITALYECYNGAQTLYFLMEVALGGELYQIYNRKSFHGSEKHAKFYIAGVVFAFEHMHERRILYRDLKPENLLLNEKGYLKVTDMGLAKFVIGKTYTTCGTPDYFAPELISSAGHTNAMDWWTVGILTFELMSGHPPFEAAYPMQVYSKVMQGINKVNFPPKCQGAVSELIKGLLKANPSERLPVRPGGVKNLKDCKWYSGFDWQEYFDLKSTPPYIPVVKSKKDIGNFSASKEDMPKMVEYVDDGSGWDKDFAT